MVSALYSRPSAGLSEGRPGSILPWSPEASTCTCTGERRAARPAASRVQLGHPGGCSGALQGVGLAPGAHPCGWVLLRAARMVEGMSSTCLKCKEGYRVTPPGSEVGRPAVHGGSCGSGASADCSGSQGCKPQVLTGLAGGPPGSHRVQRSPAQSREGPSGPRLQGEQPIAGFMPGAACS